MSAPLELNREELEAIADPQTLLTRAWELEPLGRWAEREAVLNRLEALLASGDADGPVPAAPPGRDWRLELLAERAIDLGRSWRLDEANSLVDQVVAKADPSQRLALGRAMLASGQALAWACTDEGSRRAARAFAQAIEHFEAIGHRDWKGSALLRWGHAGCFQRGDLIGAVELIGRAVDSYVDQARRAGALPFYADALIDLGEFDRAQELLLEGEAIARVELKSRAYEMTWGLARIAAGRGEAEATARLLRQAEDEARDYELFGTHIGNWFLLEAAEMLDRVGLSDDARAYFERAREQSLEPGGTIREEIMQTRAVLDARSGDPLQALEQLQALARGDWLEKRLIWRHTLMTAWATFRVGREGAGELTARALQQAEQCGTVNVAVAGEPDLVAALAPEAERWGSPLARELLLRGRGERAVVIRLFGTTSIRRASGEDLELPAGMPGELVRLLGLHEDGLPVEQVLQTLFPQVDERTARERLRQVLTRLRAATGELAIRDGERLTLVPAWVDVREFVSATPGIRHAKGARSVQLAYGALALCAPGSLLPEHPYEEWAEQAREHVEQLQLELLELIAADATRRGSNQEALTALEAAIKLSPDDPDLHAAIRTQLDALGRHRASDYLGS